MIPGKMRFNNNDPVADDDKRRQPWRMPGGRQMGIGKGHNRYLFCFNPPLLCFDHRAYSPLFYRVLML